MIDPFKLTALTIHLLDRRPVLGLIVLVRAPNRRPDSFDDRLAIYTGNDVWRQWSCSVDPGPSTLLRPANPKGGAALAPGYYPHLWKRGLHKGRDALVQYADCTVVRQLPGSTEVSFSDTLPRDTGWFGINCHDGRTPDWSAGCTILQREDLEELLTEETRQSRQLGPNPLHDVLVVDAAAWNLGLSGDTV